jgi:glycine/D-amino acid oxidase-like deaminating enzyme
MSNSDAHTVVIGGGIIGLSTAYFLASTPDSDGETAKVTIIDNAPSLLQSTSGAANGGTGPGDGNEPLCELNFSLLTRLKEEHRGFDEWCHRECQTVKVVPRAGGSGGDRDDSEEDDDKMPSWLAGWEEKHKAVKIGGTFEHVFPRLVCEFLIRRCREMGVTILTDTEIVDAITSTNGDDDGVTTLAAVRVQSRGGNSTTTTPRTIHCQKLLISAGAWTPQLLRRLFPATLLDIPLVAGPPSMHWLNVRDPRWTPDQINERATQVLFEEVLGFPLNLTNYSNGIIYVGQRSVRTNHVGDPGYLQPPNGKDATLPADAASAKPDQEALDTLRKLAAKALGLGSAEELDVVREGRAYYSVPTCQRPISTEISPALLGWGKGKDKGHVHDGSGVFVSFGHDSGISYMLGNGKVLSEMMLGHEELSCDMSQFSIPDEYVQKGTLKR